MKRGFPQGRLAIRTGRGLLNHLVHCQPCGLFPTAKPPSRLNYLRDWDSVAALGKQLIAQSISPFQFFWLHGKRLEKIKSKWKVTVSQGKSSINLLLSPLLSFPSSFQSSKIIFNGRNGTSDSFTHLFPLGFYLSVWGKWQQGKLAGQKEYFWIGIDNNWLSIPIWTITIFLVSIRLCGLWVDKKINMGPESTVWGLQQ